MEIEKTGSQWVRVDITKEEIMKKFGLEQYKKWEQQEFSIDGNTVTLQFCQEVIVK